MLEFATSLSPWITHAAIGGIGFVLGVIADMVLVYRGPENLRGD